MTWLGKNAPGIVVAATLATAATTLGRALPMVGAPVIALFAGAIIGVPLRRSVAGTGVLGPGLTLTRRRVLGAAIVVLGLDLPFGAVVTVGRQSAVVMGGTLLVGAIAAVLFGRLLALDRESATLVAVGTTICGASAIAAATAVIRPNRERVAYALGTIFVFNIVAVLVYPPIGHLLGLSQQAFGLWAGTAINDTSSVLAAGVMFGTAAAHFAVIVKLVRSLMIIPSRAVPARFARGRIRRRATLLVGSLAQLSTWLIAAVLAAIGTALTWQQVRSAGSRPLLFGAILALVLAVTSLILQAVTGWR